VNQFEVIVVMHPSGLLAIAVCSILVVHLFSLRRWTERVAPIVCLIAVAMTVFKVVIR
jgi:hypothetical protein